MNVLKQIHIDGYTKLNAHLPCFFSWHALVLMSRPNTPPPIKKGESRFIEFRNICYRISKTDLCKGAESVYDPQQLQV